MVTETADTAVDLAEHDVAVFDLGAVADMTSYSELQRLLNIGNPVVGLVYEDGPNGQLGEGSAAHLIRLSVTPDRLLEVLSPEAGPDGHRALSASELRLPAGLTAQELRVLQLIAAGLSNGQIAEEMCLSINSIKTYIRQANRKIGGTTRSQAVLWSVQHGLAGPDTRRARRRTSQPHG